MCSLAENLPAALLPQIRELAVNARTAERSHEWRKSLSSKDINRQSDEFSSVPRSATLPNEVIQKGGAEKRRGKEDRGTR